VAASPARFASSAEERLDAELAAHQLRAADFSEVDWLGPLDVEARIAETPLASTTKGMFCEQLARAARKVGMACEARHVPFRDYPLRDFMRLLWDYARVRYPDLPTREAFRRVGWEAFSVLMNSVAGRVIFAFARRDVQGVLRMAPEGYKHCLSHCSVSLQFSSPEQTVLALRNVYNFPECYQVGVVEGGCRAFGADPRIRTRVFSHADIDMLIRW
jgi:uncharacterized protein (TIGR02265 family)